MSFRLNFTPAFDSLIPIALQGTIFWRFEDVFCWFLHSICWMSILLLPVYLTQWHKKCHVFRPSRRKFSPSLNLIWPSVASSHSIPHFCCWYITCPCDLNLWPFDLGQLSYMASYVDNPSIKFEAPTAICSWVMSSDTSTLNMTLTT